MSGLQALVECIMLCMRYQRFVLFEYPTVHTYIHTPPGTYGYMPCVRVHMYILVSHACTHMYIYPV